MSAKFKNYLTKRVSPNDHYDKLLEFPQYIEIETVNACNARCPMCTINDWERNYPVMKDDVFKRISEELIENKRFLKRVSLYRDGEPLIDKKLPSRVNKFFEAGIKNTSIATNVSLLNESRSRDLLKSGIGLIIMSIDSLDKSIFEKIRVRLDFDVVKENAIKFFELRDKINPDCKIWVRMIRQESNKSEWEDYLKFWKKYAKDNDRVYYHNIFNWGDQLKDYKSISKSYEPNLPCVALWSLMVFFANGDVPLCNVDFNNKFPTGSIMNSTIRELWNSKIMSSRRELHLNGKKEEISICKNCNVWDEVHGEELVSSEYAEKVSIKNV
jgi:radical SAM protein with 4Fe4S-binding SPASM domain